MGAIEGGAERFFTLLDYLIEADLQPPAQDYLSSVARLYVWGFFGEAIVLARSALQLALDERLGGALPPQKTEGRTRDLHYLIRAADSGHLKRLDSAAISDANFIKTAGDAAVHRTLGSTAGETSVVIAALGRVLNQLCARADA